MTRESVSKPVPRSVTSVPPVAGPDVGEMLVNERPASWVTSTFWASFTQTVVVLGVGSGFGSRATNVIVPFPIPNGASSGPNQYWFQSQVAHHRVYCCAET